MQKLIQSSLALLLLLVIPVHANISKIQFLDYQFDPLIAVPDVDQSPIENSQGNGLFFIQFTDKIKQHWLDNLKNQNLVILQYYPDNTYLVWGQTQRINQIESQSHIRWTGSFAKAYRKSPFLNKLSGTIKNVDIHFYNNGNLESTINQIKSTGAEVLNYYPAQPDKKLYDVIVRIEANEIDLLTNIAEVIWVGYIGDKATLDGESSSQTNAGNLDGSNAPFLDYNNWLTNIGLDGSGVIWSITDTGVDYDHPDLNSRIIGGFSYAGCTSGMPGDDPSSGGHGTHVAGITGGDATSAMTDADGFLYGLGVAPAYSIFAQNPICPGSASWPPAGGWQELTKQALIGGAIGSNNSWTSGEGTAHGYQSTERTHDFMAKDGNFDTAGIAEEFMLVFSAGNSGAGTNTLTSPKEAKNIIVTAATQTFRVSGNVDALASFSSRGPSVDGRFVPTIAAPGGTVASTRNDDGGSCGTAIAGTSGLYSFCSGTSMAAPHTSGSLVLISQWWRQNNAGSDPSTAMAKALLINTAHDITGTASIPNFDEGWGRIQLKDLFESPTPFEFYDQQTLLDNTNDEWQISVGIVDTNKPLKVTLTWSDAPGAIGANPTLVNNLDLEVINSGNTYLGNNFTAGTSVSGGSVDNINNMENVYINSPGGSAIIKVKASNIAGDGVFFTGDETDQNFALVCSNCATQPDYTLEVNNRNISVCTPSDATYNIDINSILSFNDPVTLSITGEPTNATIDFSTNPVTPVGNSTLTVSNTLNIAAGNHSFSLNASSSTGFKMLDLTLDVFDSAPSSAALIMPSNNATLINPLTNFSWNTSSQVSSYVLEVDDNSDFSSINITTTINSTNHTLSLPLDTNTEYFWRVRATNDCDSSLSQTFSFVTEPAPGDCSVGFSSAILFTDDVESGLNGWTSNGTQNTWTINSDNPFSGASSWHAEDPVSLSDQRLITPVINLPVNQNPITFQYQNHQTIEDNNNNGTCWDGGILEISVDGGNNWVYLANDKMLTDPYDSTFSGTTNPLTGQGLLGWCGDPQDWVNSIVDLNAYAGEAVQLRFRFGSDGSVGRPAGWKIDDIKVKSCVNNDILFSNGFE